jgi:phosphate:Na+ symporter
VQTQTIVTVLGGLGLFLLGMSLMTDGLTAVGGGAMRRAMRTLAGSRWRVFALGAGTTALVQSSAPMSAPRRRRGSSRPSV